MLIETFNVFARQRRTKGGVATAVQPHPPSTMLFIQCKTVSTIKWTNVCLCKIKECFSRQLCKDGVTFLARENVYADQKTLIVKENPVETKTRIIKEERVQLRH